jgi:hypothetical protein
MRRLPGWLSTALIVLIAAAWTVSFVAGIVVAGYMPPPTVNLLFSGVITTLVLDRRHDAQSGRHAKGRDE